MSVKHSLGESADFRKTMALARTCGHCQAATTALYLLREQLLIDKNLAVTANFTTLVKTLTLDCAVCGVGKGATMHEGSPLP
jgi:hypothetical protein